MKKLTLILFVILLLLCFDSCKRKSRAALKKEAIEIEAYINGETDELSVENKRSTISDKSETQRDSTESRVVYNDTTKEFDF